MTFLDWIFAFWIVVVPPLAFLAGMSMPRVAEDEEEAKTLMGALD